MSNVSREFPEGWGNDVLSGFQLVAMGNELATFVHEPRWQGLLSTIATALNECAESILRIFEGELSPGPLFFMSAHNQYLAAARLALSGQCAGAFPTGRAAVEFALYGWRLSTDVDAMKRWHEKPEEKANRRKWGREFSFGELAQALALSDGNLAEWAKHLHEAAIDFGSHPNVAGLYAGVEHVVDNERGAISSKISYLHGMDDFSLWTMKFVAEVGICVLSFFCLTHGARADVLGLRSKIAIFKFELLALHAPNGSSQNEGTGP